jgi:hypothetical protein
MSAFDAALKKYKKTVMDRENLENYAQTLRTKMDELRGIGKRKAQEKMLLEIEKKKTEESKEGEEAKAEEVKAEESTGEAKAEEAKVEESTGEAKAEGAKAEESTGEAKPTEAKPSIPGQPDYTLAEQAVISQDAADAASKISTGLDLANITPDQIEDAVGKVEEKAAEEASELFQESAELAAAAETNIEDAAGDAADQGNKLAAAAESAVKDAIPAVEGALEKGQQAILSLAPEVQAAASAASEAASTALTEAKELGSALEAGINKTGPAVTALAGQVSTALNQIDGQLDALKDMAPGAAATSTQVASDSMSGATAALKVAGTTISDGIKAIPTDQIKDQGKAAMEVVSAEGKKAAEAASKMASLAQQSAPEIAAKATAVAKTIQEAMTQASSAVGPEAAKAAATLSTVLTESASTLSNVTREIATFASNMDPAAAEQLKNTVADIASSAIDVAHSAAGAVQGITSKLGPLLHTAAMALGATSLTALAASPALPVVAAVASVVMIIMHQKRMHAMLVAKMKSYFHTLMQMLEIFQIMNVIGTRMAYAVDDGMCIRALNAFKAYMYLTAPPELRKAFEQAGENKNSTGKTTQLSWFQKATGKLQRVFSSTSILTRLDSLFGDVMSSFLLTLSKFNIVTSIHSDVLLSMKADIVKLDEVVKFFNKIRVEPIKQCEGEDDCRTDEEIQKEAARDSDLLDKAKERLKISDEAVQKNIVKTGAIIIKIEESPKFQEEKKEIQEDITKAVDKVDPAHITEIAGPGEAPKKRGWLWGGRSQGGRSQGGRSRNRKAVPAKGTKKLRRS